MGFSDGKVSEGGKEEEGRQVELVAEERVWRDVVVVDDARNGRVCIGDIGRV